MTAVYDQRYPTNHGRGLSKQSRRERRIRQDKFNAQHGLCHWCGEAMQMNATRITESGYVKDNPRFATFEHVIPKMHGGVRAKSSANVVLAHAACNNKRHKRKWPHDPVYGGTEKPPRFTWLVKDDPLVAKDD